MSRKGFAEQIKERFGMDYDAILIKLKFDEDQAPWQISEWFNITYGPEFTPSPATIQRHLNNLSTKRMGRKTIVAKLLDLGITDYRSHLESLSTMSFEKISAYFKDRFELSISPLTIESHFKGLQIEHKVDANSLRLVKEEDLNTSLIIHKTLPLERSFNGTSDLGYIQFQGLTKGVFEIESKLIVISSYKAEIEITVKAYKGPQTTETQVLHQQDASDLLPKLTDLNFSSQCKERVLDFVQSLESMDEEEIKNLLLTKSIDSTKMEQILSQSS